MIILSTNVCFSWNEINPYDTIVNIRPPNSTNILNIMNDEGYQNEGAEDHGGISHLQDTEFGTILHYTDNLLEAHHQRRSIQRAKHVVKVDTNQKNCQQEGATDEDLVMDFLVLQCE